MRPTYLEVNLNQLKQNLENIRAHVAPAKVMPMVKANAYGHGLDGVARDRLQLVREPALGGCDLGLEIAVQGSDSLDSPAALGQ